MSVGVGGARQERHGDDVAEDVAVDDPGGTVELVLRQPDVLDHLRQHRNNQRLVQGCEEHPHAGKQSQRGAKGQASG